MNEVNSCAGLVRFAEFELNFEARELRKLGSRVALQHKPLRILEMLLRRPGLLVSRADLAKELWPHLPVSFERSLNTAINALRQVLEDSPRECRFIETRPGLGYRFIAPVERLEQAADWQPSTGRRSPSTGPYDISEDCLKGRYFLGKMTSESLQRAIGCFQSALVQDNRSAPAWAGLADCYIRLALSGVVAAAEVCHKARRSARAAVISGPDLAAAHVALGSVRMVFDGDLEGAESDWAHAISLDEGEAEAHCARAVLLSTSGKHEEALREGRRAQALEPLSLPIGLELARMRYLARDFDGAVRECWNLLSLESRFSPAQTILGLAYQQLGLPEEALTELENACVCSDRHPAAISALGCVRASLGMREQAKDALRELAGPAGLTYSSSYWRAAILAWLGERAAALEALRKAYAEQDPFLLWLHVDPSFDSIRTEAGFTALLDKLGR